jgi:hypothetical protein
MRDLAVSTSWTVRCQARPSSRGRAVVSVLGKQQLLILNRLPATLPDLRLSNRVVAGM